LLSRGNRISPSSSCLPPASSESDIIQILEPTPSSYYSCLPGNLAPFEAKPFQQQQLHHHINHKQHQQHQQQQQRQQPIMDLRKLDLSAPIHDNLLFVDNPTPTLHPRCHSVPPAPSLSRREVDHTKQHIDHEQYNHHPHTLSDAQELTLLYPPTSPPSIPDIPDTKDSHLRLPKLTPTTSAQRTTTLPPVHLNPNSPRSLSQALSSRPQHPPTSSTATGAITTDTPFSYDTAAESFADMSSSDFSTPARSTSTHAQPGLPAEGAMDSTGVGHSTLPSSNFPMPERSPGRTNAQPGLLVQGATDSTGAAEGSLPSSNFSAPACSTGTNAQPGRLAEGGRDSTVAGYHASLHSRSRSRRHHRTPTSWGGERISSSSDGAGDGGGKEKELLQGLGPSGGPELQGFVHGSWLGDLPSEHLQNLDSAWGKSSSTHGPQQPVGEAVQFGPDVEFGSYGRFGPPWGGPSSGSDMGSMCAPHHSSMSFLEGRGSGLSDGRASQRHSMTEFEGRGSKKQTLTDVRARRDSTMALERVRQAAEEAEGLQGHSCFCLGPHNPVRIAIAKVVNHQIFISFINAMVLVSCVVLMLDVVSLDPKSMKGIVLRNLDAATTAIFGVEVVLRAMHLGVLFNGPNSYLRNGWNLWDVFVVAISVVVLSIDASQVETYTWLTALRALRALRVLHAASCVEGIRVVLKALGQLIPTLTNVLWVGFLFYYIFAVLGVALLSGKMHYCADEENGEYIDPYYVLPQGETINKTWCVASDIFGPGAPRTITTSHYHSQIGVEVPPWNITTSWTRDLRRFDNVGTAMWVLYQMASVELWSAVMFNTQAAVGRETQPIREANEHIGLLWVLFMFIGSFTVLSLIVGVSINKFYEIKEEAGGQSPLLTTQQQQWLTVQQMLASTYIEDTTVPSDNRFRHLVHKLVYNQIVDNLMMFIIIANTVVMFFAHHDMNQQYELDMLAFPTAYLHFHCLCCRPTMT
ncbi:Ion transport protein-domain-containing protein, partial [Dunaliella salina]